MITFQMGITGNPPGWPQYTHWVCRYVDPLRGLIEPSLGIVWYGKGEFMTFANVNTGGYLIASIVDSREDPQVPSGWFFSGAFWEEDGRSYLFNIENGIVYVLANGEPPDGEVSNVAIDYYDAEVEVGGKCKVTGTFDYIGPQVAKTIKAEIGHQYYGVGARWSSHVTASITVRLDASSSPVTYDFEVSIPITAGRVNPAESPFDLRVMVDGEYDRIDNVITVTEEAVPSGPFETEIYEIAAPSEAAVGEVVPVSVYVRSLSSETFPMALVGVFKYDGGRTITFPVTYYDIEPNIAVCFEGSFTMPASGGTIHAISSWWNGTVYIKDDEMMKEVALAEVPSDGEPPDEEKPWWEKNQTLVLGGIAALTVAGVVLLRR